MLFEPVEAAGDGKPLLEVSALAKRFGGFQALAGVSFGVRAGEVLGLIGPNGSGKTTCINVITGLYRPNGGSIRFHSQLIGGWPSHRLVHLGINRTFQVPKPFKSLSVRQNLEVAVRYGHGRLGFGDIPALLEFLELDRFVDRQANELTSAQQKMLDLGRALATGPELLCIDELGAGLNPAELARVAARLRHLAQAGLALLVVEHLMDFVGEVTDRLIVLNAGKNIFAGSLSEAVRDKQVTEVFLGAPDDH